MGKATDENKAAVSITEDTTWIGCEMVRFSFWACFQYCRMSINTLRTGDADLRFYITTVQDG